MKLIYKLVVLFVFSFPAYAEQQVAPPVLPSDITSWERVHDKSCTIKNNGMIRGVVYFREDATGQEVTILLQLSLNEALVVHGVVSGSKSEPPDIQTYVQHPKGVWTLYPMSEREKMREQMLKVLDLTENEHADCLNRLK